MIIIIVKNTQNLRTAPQWHSPQCTNVKEKECSRMVSAQKATRSQWMEIMLTLLSVVSPFPFYRRRSSVPYSYIFDFRHINCGKPALPTYGCECIIASLLWLTCAWAGFIRLLIQFAHYFNGVFSFAPTRKYSYLVCRVNSGKRLPEMNLSLNRFT